MKNTPNTEERNVQWGDISRFAPLLVIVVTIALSWGSLSAQIGLLNQKTDTIIDAAKLQTTRVDILDTRQQSLSNRMTTVETMLGSRALQSNAQMSEPATSSGTIIFAKEVPMYQYSAFATPTPGSKQDTIQPVPTATPTPTLTPAPAASVSVPILSQVLRTIGL